MSRDRLHAIAPLAPAFYLAGLVLVTVPLIDFAFSIFPLRPYELQWRFATASLLPGYFLTVLLGVVLLNLTAALAGHRKAQRLLGFSDLLATLVLLAIVSLFVLDAVALRGPVPAGVRLDYDRSIFRALGQYVLILLAFLMLTIGGFRASRNLHRRGSPQAGAPLGVTSQTARGMSPRTGCTG